MYIDSIVMNKVMQWLYTSSESRDNRHSISKSWECWFLSCLVLIAPLSSSAWIFIWSLLAGKLPAGFMLLLALVLSWCKCALDNANLKCWKEDLGLYPPWSWMVCPLSIVGWPRTSWAPRPAWPSRPKRASWGHRERWPPRNARRARELLFGSLVLTGLVLL